MLVEGYAPHPHFAIGVDGDEKREGIEHRESSERAE